MEVVGRLWLVVGRCLMLLGCCGEVPGFCDVLLVVFGVFVECCGDVVGMLWGGCGKVVCGCGLLWGAF